MFMLSQLAVLSGITGLPNMAVVRRRREERNIRFPFLALDVTTLIIDLGKQQLHSFNTFLEYERLIYVFDQDERCHLSSEKGY